MQLRIKVNDVPLELGGSVPVRDLEDAAFSKVGLVKRLFGKQPAGQTVYTADHCELACFTDDFRIYPCTHRYLNDDRQWETSAAVVVEKGALKKVEFRVIDGRYAAANFLERFQEACSSVLGEPEEESRYLIRWRNGTTNVASVLHRDMVNVDFLWELNPGS